jgi:hypothetical protein
MALTKHDMHILLNFKMELHIMPCFKSNRLQMTSTMHELHIVQFLKLTGKFIMSEGHHKKNVKKL